MSIPFSRAQFLIRSCSAPKRKRRDQRDLRRDRRDELRHRPCGPCVAYLPRADLSSSECFAFRSISYSVPSRENLHVTLGRPAVNVVS